MDSFITPDRNLTRNARHMGVDPAAFISSIELKREPLSSGGDSTRRLTYKSKKNALDEMACIYTT